MKIRKEYCQWHEVVETPAECSMKPTCKPAAHTSTLLATFDKFCRSDMEQKDNVVAMRLEIVRAVNAHEELIALVKELRKDWVQVQSVSDERDNWGMMERIDKAVAKAEGR